MVKRLQSEKTKLQLQLSQARETKLLNDGARTGRVTHIDDVESHLPFPWERE